MFDCPVEETYRFLGWLMDGFSCFRPIQVLYSDPNWLMVFEMVGKMFNEKRSCRIPSTWCAQILRPKNRVLLQKLDWNYLGETSWKIGSLNQKTKTWTSSLSFMFVAHRQESSGRLVHLDPSQAPTVSVGWWRNCWMSTVFFQLVMSFCSCCFHMCFDICFQCFIVVHILSSWTFHIFAHVYALKPPVDWIDVLLFTTTPFAICWPVQPHINFGRPATRMDPIGHHQCQNLQCQSILFVLWNSKTNRMSCLFFYEFKNVYETPKGVHPFLLFFWVWVSTVSRCTLYIRCYKASLCERTLLLVQELTITWRADGGHIKFSLNSKNGVAHEKFAMLDL